MPLQCTEDGNDLLSRMVNRLIRVISAELKMPRTFKDWNLATTSLTICWPSPGSRAGGELIYLWLGPKTAWIILCHIWNISWHFPTQMGSPFNKATSTSVPAPGQQGFFFIDQDAMGCTRPARWQAKAFSSEHSDSVWLDEDCRQLKKASGSLGQTCLFHTTTRLISRKEQELAKCIDMMSIPIIIALLHINIIILVRSYTMPKRSMRAWRHTGRS